MGGLVSPPYSAPSFARLVAELLGRGWVGSGSGGVSGPPYCPLCRKSFTRAWSLQRHMADTHFYVPQSFECDVCGRSYRSRNSLVSHKSQYHGGTSGSRASLSKEAVSSSDNDNVSIKGEKHVRGESEWISWNLLYWMCQLIIAWGRESRFYTQCSACLQEFLDCRCEFVLDTHNFTVHVLVP